MFKTDPRVSLLPPPDLAVSVPIPAENTSIYPWPKRYPVALSSFPFLPTPLTPNIQPIFAIKEYTYLGSHVPSSHSPRIHVLLHMSTVNSLAQALALTLHKFTASTHAHLPHCLSSPTAYPPPNCFLYQPSELGKTQIWLRASFFLKSPNHSHHPQNNSKLLSGYDLVSPPCPSSSLTSHLMEPGLFRILDFQCLGQ